MPVFKIDFYVQATLGREVRFEEDSKRMLEALKQIQVLKNIKMSEAKSSHEKWFEFEGSIEIPEGSKAFVALLRHRDEKDPYDVFLRIDVNKESETREKAEREIREWVDGTFGGPLKRVMGITNMKIGTPLEIIKEKKTSRNLLHRTHTK